MIKLKAKTSDGKTQTLTLPQSWKETKVGQFQKIALQWDCKDAVQLFSIQTGQEYQTIYDSTDIELEAKLYAAVSYVYREEIDWANLPIPKSINIFGRVIEIPKNVGKLSIGQAIIVKNRMQAYVQEFKDKLDCPVFVKDFFFDGLISFVTAVYLQPLFDNDKFDRERCEHVEKFILQMPITEIYPIGFFLLMQCQNSGKHSTTRWQAWKSMMIFRRKLQKWRKLNG